MLDPDTMNPDTQDCYKLHVWFRSQNLRIVSGSSWNRIQIKISNSHLQSKKVSTHTKTKSELFFTRQCSGSMTFWCGSGSSDPCLWLNGSGYGCGFGSGSGSWIRTLLFSSLTFKMPAKNYFLPQFFLLVTFWRYIYIIFQRLKVKKSYKIVGFRVFLIIFAWW